MKKKLYIFFFLNAIELASFSQVSGYMGKRCSIGYSVWMHPAIKGFTDFLGSSNPHDDISLNVTQALELDYIVTKRSALCLGFQYSYLGMGYINEGSTEEYRYKGKERYPATLISRGFSIGYKLFPKARIAPVGTYIKWDIIGLFNTLKFSTEGVTQRTVVGGTGWTPVSIQYLPIPLETKKLNNSGFSVAFSLGRQRVYADRIVLDGGIRFAIAFANSPYSSIGYGTKFRVTERLFYNQIVNLRLGIGFLAF